FSSRRRHTRFSRDWSSDVCSSDLILELIRESIDRRGMPPTRAEIARAFGFRSPNAAEEHLRALERKGMIEIVAGTSRGIRLAAQIGRASCRERVESAAGGVSVATI